MATPVSAVQFRSIDDVIEAYENMDVPCLAIWSRKQLMFPFECTDVAEGVAFLENILSKLSDSAAIYTLCVYKKVGADGVLSNTPFSASFNFQLKRLRDEQGNYLQPSIGGLNDNAILSELKALKLDNQLIKDKLESMEMDEGNDEDDGLGLVGKLLAHPVIAGIVKNYAAILTTPKIGNGDVAAPRNAAIAGVNQDARLSAAIEVLKGHDPSLVEHLEKLAQIAEADPNSFKMFLGYLDGIS